MQGIRPKYYIAYILVEYYKPYRKIEYKVKDITYNGCHNIMLDYCHILLNEKNVHLIDSYIVEVF